MKKTLLCLLSVACLSMNAQVYELSHEGEIVNNGDVITVTRGENVLGDWKMKCAFSVKNVSSRSYAMKMDKVVIEEAMNTSNTMCWDFCMEPYQTTATCSNIAPQEISETPYGEVWLNADGEAMMGTTIVKYTFATSSKGDPKVTVEVHYSFDPENPSGITSETISSTITVKAINGTIEINSPVNKTSLIYDITGRLVKSVNLNEGVNYIDNLPAGVYIVEKQKIIL